MPKLDGISVLKELKTDITIRFTRDVAAHVQRSLPAGGLRLCREGVEPSGPLRKVLARSHDHSPFLSLLTLPTPSLVARSVGLRGVYRDISNTWLARGYLSSSLICPARQSGLHHPASQNGSKVCVPAGIAKDGSNVPIGDITPSSSINSTATEPTVVERMHRKWQKIWLPCVSGRTHAWREANNAKKVVP
jgi:hypothetical protein